MCMLSTMYIYFRRRSRLQWHLPLGIPTPWTSKRFMAKTTHVICWFAGLTSKINKLFERFFVIFFPINLIYECGRGPRNKTWRAAKWRPMSFQLLLVAKSGTQGHKNDRIMIVRFRQNIFIRSVRQIVMPFTRQASCRIRISQQKCRVCRKWNFT
jgi:hypothetical protein